MKSLWSDADAAKFTGPAFGNLGLRVYTSRLLGQDKSLVLHGGGNTSVKLKEKNLFGEERELLYVKGSGWDLETIEARAFPKESNSTPGGMTLLSHGVFSFSEDARESYERMIELVSMAEKYLEAK